MLNLCEYFDICLSFAFITNRTTKFNAGDKVRSVQSHSCRKDRLFYRSGKGGRPGQAISPGVAWNVERSCMHGWTCTRADGTSIDWASKADWQRWISLLTCRSSFSSQWYYSPPFIFLFAGKTWKRRNFLVLPSRSCKRWYSSAMRPSSTSVPGWLRMMNWHTNPCSCRFKDSVVSISANYSLVCSSRIRIQEHTIFIFFTVNCWE